MLAMKYSYKQIVLGDTKDRNSVMVAPLSVDEETSFRRWGKNTAFTAPPSGGAVKKFKN